MAHEQNPHSIPGSLEPRPDGSVNFISDQKEFASGLPVVTAAWPASRVALAQEEADSRGVPLGDVLGEWTARRYQYAFGYLPRTSDPPSQDITSGTANNNGL